MSTAPATPAFRLVVEDLFTIVGRGTVFAGVVQGAPVSVGDPLAVVTPSRQIRRTVIGLECLRKQVRQAEVGVLVGVLCRAIADEELSDCFVMEGESRRVHGLVLGPAPKRGWWELWRS
jgi:elongation factor Tu